MLVAFSLLPLSSQTGHGFFQLIFHPTPAWPSIRMPEHQCHSTFFPRAPRLLFMLAAISVSHAFGHREYLNIFEYIYIYTYIHSCQGMMYTGTTSLIGFGWSTHRFSAKQRSNGMILVEVSRCTGFVRSRSGSCIHVAFNLSSGKRLHNYGKIHHF